MVPDTRKAKAEVEVTNMKAKEVGGVYHQKGVVLDEDKVVWKGHVLAEVRGDKFLGGGGDLLFW